MNFNVDDLTNQDIMDIEDATGKAFTDILDTWTFKVACAWLALRKENPAATFDEVAKGKWSITVEALSGDNPKGQS